MLAPEQSRAARGWLDWSQDDLAQRAKVSLSTIRDFEKGRRVPIANNLDAIHIVGIEIGKTILYVAARAEVDQLVGAVVDDYTVDDVERFRS